MVSDAGLGVTHEEGTHDDCPAPSGAFHQPVGCHVWPECCTHVFGKDLTTWESCTKSAGCALLGVEQLEVFPPTLYENGSVGGRAGFERQDFRFRLLKFGYTCFGATSVGPEVRTTCLFNPKLAQVACTLTMFPYEDM